MKRILVLALFAVLMPVHAVPQADRVALRGVVVRNGTSEPLVDARVTIGKTDIPPQFTFPFSNILAPFLRSGTEMHTGTDSQGRFDFSGLETGDYIVMAEADGYESRRDFPDERTRFSDFAKRLTIRTSEPPEVVTLSLFRLSRIEGVVRGPAGQIVSGIDVELGYIEYSDGHREWHSVGSTETNDRGEYQFSGLGAGKYYAAVVAELYGSNKSATGGSNSPHLATFYPNAQTFSSAKPISIGGSDIRADFNLPPMPTNWKTISGKVMDGVRVRSTPPNFAPTLPEILNLVPRGDGNFESLLLPDRFVEIGPPGEFQMKDVAPGVYDLYASSNQWTHTFTGHISVEVKDKDITGLNVVFDSRSADVITGRIVDDSGKVYPS